MNEITFPLLNLKINVPRIAINILGINVYWYAIIIVLAIIIALLVCKKNEKNFDIKFSTITDLSIWILPISIICARIYYILFCLDYYVANPKEILNFRGRRISNIRGNNWRSNYLLFLL